MANNKDLFAPPTEEEIELFSPPTEEEVSLFAPPTEDEIESDTEEIGVLKAGLYGTGQGLTFGFADELAGLSGAALEKPLEKLGVFDADKEDALSMLTPEARERIERTGSYQEVGAPEKSLEQLYTEYRDLARKKYSKAEEDQPLSYLAGDVGGSLLLPGGVLKSAGKVALKTGGKGVAKTVLKSKARKAAAGGAGVGALEAAGRSEEEPTSLEGIGDVGLGALGGAALGPLAAKFAPKTSGQLKKAATEAEKDANIAALKSIGAKAKDIKDELGIKTRKFATKDTAKGAGTALLEEGVIKKKQDIGETKEIIVDKLKEISEKRISPAVKKLDELTQQQNIPIEEFTNDYKKFENKIFSNLNEIAESVPYARTSDVQLYKDMEKTTQKLMEDIDLALNSPNKLTKLNDTKRKLQSQINWNDPQATAYNQFLIKAQNDVSKLMEDIGQKVSPDITNDLKKANTAYSNLSRANVIAGNELARELASTNKLNISDYITSAVISGVSGVRALGPAAVATKKGIEKSTGKPLDRLTESVEALVKTNMADKMRKKAVTRGSDIISPTEMSAKGVATASSVIDDPKEQSTRSRRFITQNPENLSEMSQNLRQYGETGNSVANIIDSALQKDDRQRKALLFGLMQNPAYRSVISRAEKGLDSESGQ